jgi:S-adenosylmethionine hydrolase
MTPTMQSGKATPIALLTDYGSTGPYVGALKAVILDINPKAIIFDITHEIPAQSVEEGAFVLAQIVPFLPAGTVCVGVVDPGVGTARRAIGLETARAAFVGPDNGLVSGFLHEAARMHAQLPGPTAVHPGEECLAAEISASPVLHRPVSTTFHGRDLFAPVAAHLSLGEKLQDLGRELTTVAAFPPWRASKQPDGSFNGRVVSIDRFGNLITDIRADDLPKDGRMRTSVAGVTLSGLQRTFQDGPEFVVYEGSSGFIEIGRRNSSAATMLGVGMGDSVAVNSTADTETE